MVQRLLANKPAGLFGDYEVARFTTLLGAAFDLRRTEVLPGGTRTLFYATPRG
jgi:hypothetical protein